MIRISFSNEEKEIRYDKDTCTYLLTHRYKDSDFCITKCYIEQEIIDILNSNLQDQTRLSFIVYPKQSTNGKENNTKRCCDCQYQELKERLDKIEKLISELQIAMMNQSDNKFTDEDYYKKCIKDWHEDWLPLSRMDVIGYSKWKGLEL